MSNNIKVYMKELGGASWTDVSSSCLKTNFIIREGFGALGSASDVSKLSIEYKADDLASATLFHTSAKAIRVSVDGITRFEGYTEGNASVKTTNSIGLAWVKLSAFPYSKAFEESYAPADEILSGYKVMDSTAPEHSLVHILLSKIQNHLPEPYKTAIAYYGYSIATSENIGATANPVLIEEGESYLEVLDALLGEFGLARYVAGNYIHIVKPYAENKPIEELGYNDILINPNFTTKPYKQENSPIVTVGRIVSYENDLVYMLKKEGESASDSDKIEAGALYPADGNLQVDYSSDRENDDVSFLYADGLTYEYKATGAEGAEMALDAIVKELGSASALFRFQNKNSDYAFMRQLKVFAQTAYYKDTSLKVEETESKARERDDIETRFISTSEQASSYIQAINAESLAERFTATFESGKINLSPASVVRIGDIPFSVLVRYREDNLATGISKYSGVAYSVKPIATTSVVKRQTASSSDSLQYISLSLDGFAYTYDADGNLEPANQIISATVKRYGIADNPVWTINGTMLDTTATTINVPSSYMQGNLIIVNVKVGEFESEDYIYKVVNGKVGADGEAGPAGPSGPAGADGESLYTWIMYANNPSGYDMTSNPEGMSYIGIAYNKSTATPSTEPKDYVWTLIKGTSAKNFNISVDSSTYIRDLRDAATVNSIKLTIDKQGYSGEPLVTVPNNVAFANNVITIPYANNYDSVTINVTLEQISKSITLSVIDKTEYNKNFGELTAYPTGIVLDGDYFSCTKENSNNLQVGFAYERVAGDWKPMQANNINILNCLNSMLASGTTIPKESVLFSWVQNLIAQNASIETLFANSAFINAIKAIEGLFENIQVVGSLSGNVTGDIANTVLITTSKNDGELSFSAQNPSGADGVLASEVKDSITAYMRNKTDKTAYSASGSLDGWQFDSIMRVSSVNSTVTELQTRTSSIYGSDSLTFTNTKPVGIKLYIRPTRKRITEKYYEESGYYGWEEARSYGGGGNTEPSVWDTYPPDSGFSNAGEPTSEGEKYYQYTDIEGSNGNYTWTVVVWESVWIDTSGYRTAEYMGTITIGDKTYTSDSEIVINNLPAGQSFTVNLTGVSTQHGGEIISPSSTGSVGFYWKESENYNAGIGFIKDGTVLKYLADMPDKILTSNVSLKVSTESVINLPMGDSSAWPSNFHKLYNLDWAYAGGTYSNFNASVCSVSVTDSAGNTKSVSGANIYGFTSVNTADRKGFTISGTTPISLYSSDFVRAYSLRISTYSKPTGVYSQNILPMANGTYSLGEANTRWKNICCDSINAANWSASQDSSGNLVFTYA